MNRARSAYSNKSKAEILNSYTIEEMFQVSKRSNSAFGIPGYTHPQQY